MGELYTGLSLHRKNHEQEAARFRDFLARPVVEAIPVDNQVAHEYGHLVAELRRAGAPLPANDIWIAACAARTSSVVLTRDSRFIARVGCVVLRPGPLTPPRYKSVE